MNECAYCGHPVQFTGCPSQGCDGWWCPECSVGCDLDALTVEEGGVCATIWAGMEEERRYDSKF